MPGQRLYFGAGGAADTLMSNLISYLWTPVYVVAMGLDPAVIGLVMALPRLYDAFTDVIMGNISDNTRSRFGRRRPYIFFGSLATGLAFVFLWTPPPHASPALSTGYILLMVLVYYTCYTLFSVPYSALGFEVSYDAKERTRLAGTRTFFAMVAYMSLPWAYKLSLVIGDSSLPSPQRELDGIVPTSIIFGVAMMCFGLIPALGCREKTEAHKQEKIAILSALKTCFANTPFRYILAAIFFVIVGTSVFGSAKTYLNIFYLFPGHRERAADYLAYSGTIAGFASMFGVALVTWLGNRLGKRHVVILGQSVVVVGSLCSWFLFSPQYPWLQLVLAPLLSLGNLTVWLLLFVMVAEATDLDELQTGLRREGMYTAIYSWTFKTSSSLSFFLSGLVLTWTGIDTQASAQTPGSIFTLRILSALVPAASALLAVFFTWKCSLTEKKAREIRALLDVKNKKTP
jgi:GPH family glycoside/pentoside/hexuronide:cation symporter